MRSCLACLLVAITLAPAAAKAGSAARACQDAGSDQGVVEGRLRLYEGIGPAAFIVTLPGGLCLKGSDAPAGETTTVQLYTLDASGMQQLYSLVGQRIVARGRLTAGKTYQQKAPVLMEVLDIAAK